MGHLARVGVYGPTSLLPYVALPSSQGGSTGYFSTVTSDGTVTVSPTTAKSGCKFNHVDVEDVTDKLCFNK